MKYCHVQYYFQTLANVQPYCTMSTYTGQTQIKYHYPSPIVCIWLQKTTCNSSAHFFINTARPLVVPRCVKVKESLLPQRGENTSKSPGNSQAEQLSPSEGRGKWQEFAGCVLLLRFLFLPFSPPLCTCYFCLQTQFFYFMENGAWAITQLQCQLNSVANGSIKLS